MQARAAVRRAGCPVWVSAPWPACTRNANAAGITARMWAPAPTIRCCAGVAYPICLGLASRANMRKWLGLALSIVVIDQITKYFIVQKFVLHETLVVTPFFNLVRVHNTGAAFSMLADAGGWQRVFFIGIAVAAS